MKHSFRDHMMLGSRRPKKRKRKPIAVREKSFYESDAWRSLRKQVFTIYDMKCMNCRATGVQMHVDHIEPVSLRPDLKLSLRNLQILCVKCNMDKSNKNSNDYRSSKERAVLESYIRHTLTRRAPNSGGPTTKTGSN